MADETPVLDTLADMTAASLARNTLAPRELMLVRIAALVAVDAAPASYLMNAEAAREMGVTADDIQGVMIGIAPVVGAPRVVSAAGKILRALGLAIAVAESELADDDDEE
jgi:alkylhydroperoxidase/carboxymuconolactone decarboxylase family protein YurZ